MNSMKETMQKKKKKERETAKTLEQRKVYYGG